jgi:hypothetical protein
MQSGPFPQNNNGTDDNSSPAPAITPMRRVYTSRQLQNLRANATPMDRTTLVHMASVGVLKIRNKL